MRHRIRRRCHRTISPWTSLSEGKFAMSGTIMRQIVRPSEFRSQSYAHETLRHLVQNEANEVSVVWLLQRRRDNVKSKNKIHVGLFLNHQQGLLLFCVGCFYFFLVFMPVSTWSSRLLGETFEGHVSHVTWVIGQFQYFRLRIGSSLLLSVW